MKYQILGSLIGLVVGALTIFHYVNAKILIELLSGQRVIWCFIFSEITLAFIMVVGFFVSYYLGKTQPLNQQMHSDQKPHGCGGSGVQANH